MLTTVIVTGPNFGRFSCACLLMAAILDFEMFKSEPFEEIQGINSEFKLITPKSITVTYFGSMAVIFVFLKGYISAVLRA